MKQNFPVIYLVMTSTHRRRCRRPMALADKSQALKIHFELSILGYCKDIITLVLVLWLRLDALESE